jgi:hypothetical protein
MDHDDPAGEFTSDPDLAALDLHTTPRPIITELVRLREQIDVTLTVVCGIIEDRDELRRIIARLGRDELPRWERERVCREAVVCSIDAERRRAARLRGHTPMQDLVT